MRPRQKIHTIRDYEKFLKAAGFSRKEACTLATGWRKLAPTGEVNGGKAALPK